MQKYGDKTRSLRGLYYLCCYLRGKIEMGKYCKYVNNRYYHHSWRAELFLTHWISHVQPIGNKSRAQHQWFSARCHFKLWLFSQSAWRSRLFHMTNRSTTSDEKAKSCWSSVVETPVWQQQALINHKEWEHKLTVLTKSALQTIYYSPRLHFSARTHKI